MEIAELMILGFISLLLVFLQNYIAKICIPASAGDIMLPCSKEAIRKIKEGRRLLWTEIMDFSSNRRYLAAADTTFTCPKVSLQSISL
jgi:mlo protein